MSVDLSSNLQRFSTLSAMRIQTILLCSFSTTFHPNVQCFVARAHVKRSASIDSWFEVPLIAVQSQIKHCVISLDGNFCLYAHSIPQLFRSDAGPCVWHNSACGCIGDFQFGCSAVSHNFFSMICHSQCDSRRQLQQTVRRELTTLSILFQ